MANTAAPVHRRRISCFACRSSKRRCDRVLPACTLCQHKEIDCHYPHRRGQRQASPASEDVTSSAYNNNSTIQVAAGPGTEASTSPVPALLDKTSTDGNVAVSFSTAAIKFLAPDLFQELRLWTATRHSDVPGDVLGQLGARQELRETANTFFRMTRSWMPIINSKHHLGAILSPLLAPLDRSSALLALCMKLYCSLANDQLERAQRHSLYLLTKRFYAEVERTDELSIKVMQAAVFITVFEMSEVIYPAAYLTVGNLVRYGTAMGLDRINEDRTGSSHLEAATTRMPWIDVEEMRRVWWAVLVLDRLLNISHPTWCLITKDPKFEDFLPVDDERFYDASSTPEDAEPISHAFHHRLGAFARLGQAIYLISKVMEVARSSTGHDTDSPATESSYDSIQLCRTLEALVRANEVEVSVRKLPFCSQSLVSYIGVLILQQRCWQHQNEVSLQTPPGDPKDLIFSETYSALNTLDRISKNVRYGDPGDEPCPKKGQSTLFLVELVYQALSTLTMIRVGLPPGEFESKSESLRWLLRCMIKRWYLAGVYERILEAKEALASAIDV